MKNLNIIKGLLLLITLFSFISCEDYLNKLPENKVPSEDVDFTQTENMVLPVNGVYARFNSRIAKWNSYASFIVRGDDVNAAGDQVPLKEADEFIYSSSSWTVEVGWKETYRIAIDANSALVQLEKYKEHITNDADMELYRQYVAEVRTLRAFCYFVITRLWGEVPIIEDNNKMVLPKTSVPEIYAYLETELAAAATDLPAIHPNQAARKGAITKYTALTIKAQVHLMQGDYQKVLDATDEIIQSGLFSLYPDFYQLFKKPGILCNESILELQFPDLGTGEGDYPDAGSLFKFMGPSWTPSVDKSGGGWQFIEPTPKYINFMMERNESVRLQTSVLFTPDGINELKNIPTAISSYINATTPNGDIIENSGRAKHLNGKAYLPSSQLTAGRTGYGEGNNFRVLRYADVLLMHAEAKVNGATGGTMTAVEAINKVRVRAKLGTLSAVTEDNIIDERFAEFSAEWGSRYFDLIRTNRAEAELGALGYTKDKTYYPIPQVQIDLNPLLAD